MSAIGHVLDLRKPAGSPVRRKCANKDCGGKKKAVQRRSAGAVKPPARGLIGLPGPGGSPLETSVMSSMGRLFGHDFSGVRVHADEGSARAARALSARAFTMGRDVYFARGQYSPHTTDGLKLIAHELTHTIQQRSSPGRAVVDESPRQEEEALRAEKSISDGSSPVVGAYGTLGIQRKVVVDDPAGKPPNAPAGVTNSALVNDSMGKLCNGFSIDASGVLNRPAAADFCSKSDSSATPQSCKCLCDMSAPKNKSGGDLLWTIYVDDTVWPHTDRSLKEVYVQSPYSGMRMEAWSGGSNEHRIQYEDWLVLAHELCGHAWLDERKDHPETEFEVDDARVTHSRNIMVENEIAREHGIEEDELRGYWWSGGHHGESISSVTVSQFKSGSADFYSTPRDERKKIDIVYDFMKNNSEVVADVIGHADRPARTAEVNEQVSKKRAENVKAVLRGKGIANERFITVEGKAATECPADGQQPMCRKAVIYMFKRLAASESHMWWGWK